MVLLAASLFGCGGDGTEPEPSSDTTPPLVSIVFPDSVGFDEDGDGFLDLRVVWSDTDSGIDLSSLRVRGIGSDSNSPNDNISDGWTTAQHDSTGLRLAETLSGLLPDQETRLEVSIADRAGNRRADTVRVTLPSGQLLTTLAGRGPGYFIVDALLCDDGLIYMTPGNAIMTVDPVRLQVTSIQAHPTYIGDQRYLACPRNSPRVYATPRMFQYDRMTDQWTLDWVRPGHFQAVAESKRESGLIYAGVGGLGVVAEVMAGDTIQRRLIPMPSSSMEREQVSALAVATGKKVPERK